MRNANKRKGSEAQLLLCRRCGECKNETDFFVDSRKPTGRYSWCKLCYKTRRYETEANRRAEVIVARMASGIIHRTKGGASAKCSYKKKGIQCLIGDTTSEVKTYLMHNFLEDVQQLISDGKTPSIDRIDSDKHYEHGNLRIIDRDENSELGSLEGAKKVSVPFRATLLDGTVMEFSSGAEAARELGINIKTVFRLAYGKTKRSRKGITFERVV